MWPFKKKAAGEAPREMLSELGYRYMVEHEKNAAWVAGPLCPRCGNANVMFADSPPPERARGAVLTGGQRIDAGVCRKCGTRLGEFSWLKVARMSHWPRAEARRSGMKEKFSSAQWLQLVFLPLDVFCFVAGIDEDIDAEEKAELDKQIREGSGLKNPLHRELMVDLAQMRRAAVSQDDWLESLQATGKLLRGQSDDALGSGIVMMPTGDIVNTPAGFDSAKEILKEKLTQLDYEYFFASLLYSAIEVAKVSGGPGPESISKEENVALETLFRFFDIELEAIRRHFA